MNDASDATVAEIGSVSSRCCDYGDSYLLNRSAKSVIVSASASDVYGDGGGARDSSSYSPGALISTSTVQGRCLEVRGDCYSRVSRVASLDTQLVLHIVIAEDSMAVARGGLGGNVSS